MKKQLRLRNKLIIVFLTILLIPTISLGYFAYSDAKKQIIEQQNVAAQSSSIMLNTNISNSLTAKIADLDYLVERISPLPLSTAKDADVRKVLNEYVRSHGDITMAYVGTSKNDMIRMPYFEYASDYKPTERDWYKSSINASDYLISPPYTSATSGDLVITISKKLPSNNAVVGIDMSLQEFNTIAGEIAIGKNGFLSIVDEKNNYISHPEHQLGSVVEKQLAELLTQDTDATQNANQITQNYSVNDVTGWKIVSNVYDQEAEDIAQSIWNKIIWVLVISTILISILSYFIIRSIVRPLNNLRSNALKISEGDLTVEIETKGNNEIAELAQAFQTMKQQLATLIVQLQSQAQSIQKSADELSATSSENSASSQQISHATQSVASSMEQQIIYIDQSNESIDEIAQGVTGIAEDASQVTELSVIAQEHALDGGQHIQKTVEKMTAINQAVEVTDTKIRNLYDTTKEIGSILSMIHSIADQTNLLALNASIEAARAGEQGKGFAVVANEVRQLAENSQRSARQIEELIKTVQHDTKLTVELMQETMQHVSDGTSVAQDTAVRFSTIIDSMKDITPRMENMTAASEEIAATITTVTQSSIQLADLAKDTAAASEEVSASTEESLTSMENMEDTAQNLLQLAEDLQQLIQKFKLS